MDDKEKKEHLKFIISRYDHYYDSINNKGQFYLGLNTFLIAGLGTAFVMNQQQHSCNCLLNILMGLVFIISFASVFLTLRAIFPYLKSGNTKDYSSLIFFGSVSNNTVEQITAKIIATTEEDIKKDLTLQIHQLAAGLTEKFENLRYAGDCLAIEFLLLIPF